MVYFCFLLVFQFIFSSCSSFNCLGQINNVDNRGIKKGIWIQVEGDSITNSERICIFHYKKGVKNGLYREYYPEGPIRCKGYYKNNIQVGKWIGYLEDGTISWWQLFDQKGNFIKRYGLMLAW